MGCGASKDPKIAVADSVSNGNKTNNYNKNNTQNRNSFKKVELKNNSQNNQSIQEPKKAPLAFVISFDENNKNGNPTRPPPGRLRLEPLKHTPQTKAEIDQKIRSAEVKREKILAERVKSSSGKKNSQLNRSYNYDDEKYLNGSANRNGYDSRELNQRKNSDERNNESRQRLLNRKRIIQNQDLYDDEIEHDRNYNRDSDQY